MSKLAWGAGLLLGTVAADQLSKFLLPTIFLNQGLALGVNLPWSWMVYLLLIAVTGWIMICLRLRLVDYAIPLGFMVGGGVSNLADRIVLGGVRDVFFIGSLYWNVADALVILGLVGIFIRGYVVWKREENIEKMRLENNGSG